MEVASAGAEAGGSGGSDDTTGKLVLDGVDYGEVRTPTSPEDLLARANASSFLLIRAPWKVPQPSVICGCMLANALTRYQSAAARRDGGGAAAGGLR